VLYQSAAGKAGGEGGAAPGSQSGPANGDRKDGGDVIDAEVVDKE
jgi:hypothetical protein